MSIARRTGTMCRVWMTGAPSHVLIAAAATTPARESAGLAALGMAGEMATFPSDSAPLRMDEVTAAHVALLRPPLALWGYSVPATEEALGVIARAVTARDTEIATLRQELNDMRAQRHSSERARLPERAAPAHDEVPAWPAAPEPASGE